jgi:hypothetical protein
MKPIAENAIEPVRLTIVSISGTKAPTRATTPTTSARVNGHKLCGSTPVLRRWRRSSITWYTGVICNTNERPRMIERATCAAIARSALTEFTAPGVVLYVGKQSMMTGHTPPCHAKYPNAPTPP